MGAGKNYRDKSLNVSVLISRQSRDAHQIHTSFLRPDGLADVSEAGASRRLASQYRAHEKSVRAGDLHAMGIIKGVSRLILHWASDSRFESVLRAAESAIAEKISETGGRIVAQTAVQAYPPKVVDEGEETVAHYAEHQIEAVLENVIILGLARENPAFLPFDFLYDDKRLTESSEFVNAWKAISAYLGTVKVETPGEGEGGESLLDLLLAPVRSSPNSLQGQLAYLRDVWGDRLGASLTALLRGMDFLEEENKIRFDPGFGPGPSTAPELSSLDEEVERFSTDLDWMPRVVMMAKSTYVWLDQLSKQYEQSITRLDQIPDEELDRFEAWGITALWLIGLWERSAASEQIKKRMGNPEAAASAYSLYDYILAEDLGGVAAYENLRDRCWERGIRVACDMVPNHTGIDGKWVMEHPDWFVQVSEPPFPGYSFHSENLSTHPDVGIFLEDHYYDRTDASVVFKRVHFPSGDTRYIYHGNDGTSLPWNDTAQINFLHPEAREAVASIIISVAKQFPIIRLDAAMVLAKKHVQRLWFPEPGQGGDIPSRAEHGLTKAEFDAAFPVEFWREVVDRVAVEAPDTLLLAEAFWMLEGYFVRTLGMHRVYNSAFMNMLKNEENAQYRDVIKKTVEFDPEILKRYVNFLNNPDEKTAVEQFGKGDKYFGVTLMMVTLPGLPMLGHGQVEGYSEKYGMEYRKAYYDEQPDSYLIERHEREIFPIARKRYLFADAENFRLYDFYGPDQHVNENVFAYSNRFRHDRALIVYNNSYEKATGIIRMSAAYTVKDGDARSLEQESLVEGLKLRTGENRFCVFRDHISGLEFIRRVDSLRDHGLYVELNGYQYQAFTDIREVNDTAGYYARLHDYLNGKGVSNLEEELKEYQLRPLHDPFSALMHVVVNSVSGPNLSKDFFSTFAQSFQQVLKVAGEWTGNGIAYDVVIARTISVLQALIQIQNELSTEGHESQMADEAEAMEHRAAVCGWAVVHPLGYLISHTGQNVGPKARNLIDAWLLDRVMCRVFEQQHFSSETAIQITGLVHILVSHSDSFADASGANTWDEWLGELFSDPEVRTFVGVHKYEGISYFSKEGFESLLSHVKRVAVIMQRASDDGPAETRENADAFEASCAYLRALAERAGYQCKEMLEPDSHVTIKS